MGATNRISLQILKFCLVISNLRLYLSFVDDTSYYWLEKMICPKESDMLGIVGKTGAIGAALAITMALGGEARAGGVTTEYLGHGDGAPSISDNGQLVAFTALAARLGGPLKLQVFLSDRQAGTTLLVSVGFCSRAACQYGNEDSVNPRVSAGGRFVVFTSAASNLVAGDTNGDFDVFVRDLRAGTTERVSVGASGTQANNRERRGIHLGGWAIRCIQFAGKQSGTQRHQQLNRRICPRSPTGHHDAGERAVRSWRILYGGQFRERRSNYLGRRALRRLRLRGKQLSPG